MNRKIILSLLLVSLVLAALVLNTPISISINKALGIKTINLPTFNPPNTITASSCSEAAVSNAVISASNNYTVIIPTGTCTWQNGITVNKTIRIIGSGENSTVILDDINNATPLFNVNLPYQYSFFRLSGMSLEPSPNRTFSAGGPGTSIIILMGTCTANGCSVIRLDHLKFTKWKAEQSSGNNFGDFMISLDDVYGVIDNIYLNETNSNGEFADIGYGSYMGIGQYGDNSWAEPDFYGSANMIYIENSTFISNNEQWTLTDTDFAPYGGGRFVIRHNKMIGFDISNHGTESTGRTRGGRLAEVYDNNYTCPVAIANCNVFVGLRSGTALVFNNTITIQKGGWLNNVVDLADFRAFAGFSPWGYCDGQGAYDENNGTVFASGIITGSSILNGELTVSDNTKNWAPDQWYDYGEPYSVVDTSINESLSSNMSVHPGFEIGSSNTTSVTTTFGYSDDYWNGNPVFSVGDSYEILRAPLCIDQSGQGQGKLISGYIPTPTGWVNDSLDPVYEWMDKINGTITQAIGGSDFTARIINNRDFYYQNATFNGASGTGYGLLANRPTTCTPQVAYWATDANDGNGELYKCTAINTWTAFYTPYTYPYPLQPDDIVTTSISSTTSTSTTSLSTTSTILPSTTTSLASTSTTGSSTSSGPTSLASTTVGATSTVNQTPTSISTISLYTTTIPSTLPTIPTTSTVPILTKQHVQNYWYVVIAGLAFAVILSAIYSIHRKRAKYKKENPPYDNSQTDPPNQSF